MANIYERQSKSAELFDLWDSAPDPVKSIIETNRYDIAHLKVNILQKTQQWSSLCELCIKIIEQALAECEEKQSLEPLEFLTENGVAVIVALVECAKNLTDADSVDAHNRIKDILSRFNSKANQSQGRSIEIARLLLMTADKQSLLEPCKTFWLRYGHLDACFSDLAPYCQHFDEEERRVFREYITSRWENDIANLSINGQDKKRDPLQTRLNALRFRFLLDLSTSEPPPIDVLNAYVVDALRLCKDAEQSGHRAFYEAGFLVIHSLASHANRELHETTTRVPFGRTAEQSRLEYQAAVLCQRLKDAKDGKGQRRLVLYSTRLHMLLGFATLGFELYRHARIKEMLTDTLSHHLLTRISHIHPFETKSIPTIDPNEELIGVIGKNEKMEVSMDGFLVPQNVKDYPYDSVVDMLGVKQALRSSLTKHLCIVERRRIARLKGEQIPEVLEQDLRSKWPYMHFKAVADQSSLRRYHGSARFHNRAPSRKRRA
jgi:N-terminal acetyltransferase B complex non-catalytic subunit